MIRIAVVAREKAYADFLMNDIAKYMNRYAEFISYSMPEIEQKGVLNEQFVLLSAFTIFQQARKYISDQSEIIVLSRALSKKQVEQLEKIPEGTRALLVNIDHRSCMYTISCMYEAGIRNLELIPYWGEGEYDKSIKVAITPDEEQIVPKDIEKIYNVGQSFVDMNSLYKIATRLGVYEEFCQKEANEARKEYYYINSSIENLVNEKDDITDKLKTVINLIDDGIIIIDLNGKIYINNKKAQILLRERANVLQGFYIQEILPEIDTESTKEKIVKISSSNLVISSVEIRSEKEVSGHIITISDFEEREEKQHGLRSKISGTSHFARYHFEDILGESLKIKKCIKTAKMIADSDAAVMITGESGTGKEMFAQSIHNSSSRKKYNFVAVNCAAIPENLLESEVFGYEEGAFTGAKKGGKAGLFELAHKGTIFLDEVGEMSLPLQSKLLRVLEEHKIMRVGSNSTIDVDVRVVSATNKDLFKMTQEGKFREDLYYRLNVCPLFIPPLRERTEDILPVFYSLAKISNSSIQLSEKSEEILLNHQWNGNIRELRNVVEYLASLGKRYIDVDDLPVLRHGKTEKSKDIYIEEKSNIIEKFILREGKEIERYYVVIKALRDGYLQGKRYGRKELFKKLTDEGILYTEGEIRQALLKLSEYGFIISPKGRGGSIINAEGIRLCSYLENLKSRGVFG